jgi:hypothetical protein
VREQTELFEHGRPPEVCARGAELSPDERYRYRLWRTWDRALPSVVWVMLNPSTADASTDDLTLKKCQGFARQWGFGGVLVVNLFAWRETDPDRLAERAAEGADVVGPENNRRLRAAIRGAHLVVCAWGAHPIARSRASAVLAMIPENVACDCLGRTSEGAPRHPSRLAYATPREVMFPRLEATAKEARRG